MHKRIENTLKIMALCCMSLLTIGYAQTGLAAPTVAKSNVSSENDLKKLNLLWLTYQDHLHLMNESLNSIRKEIDENQKNAKIAIYTRKLEETKNALNRLILVHVSANKLRQQMIEHATKYQNVYKLSAVSKPNPNQVSMYERLNAQTSFLYEQMQSTAKLIVH